ncbi:MAG: class I SAM-dependent methyltransferase [Acidobacteriota bacterium]
MSASRRLFSRSDCRRHWQLAMSSKSLKKRSKLSTLLRMLDDTTGKRCAEIGCDRGVTSYYLRKCGGDWVSADPDEVNTVATRLLVGHAVVQVDPTRLALKSASIDCVVAIDSLEHVQADDELAGEIARILAPGGTAYISTPQTGPFFVLHRLAAAVGLKPSHYGHVREGYTPAQLRALLEAAGLRVVKTSSCVRFVTEMIELVVNAAYMFVLHKKAEGGIAPATQSALRKHGLAFRLFSVLFPLLWLISQLDRLLFFSKGYIIIVKAVRGDERVGLAE